MAVSKLTIRDVKARAVVAPLATNSHGSWNDTLRPPYLDRYRDRYQGSAGRSYIFAYTTAALVPLARKGWVSVLCVSQPTATEYGRRTCFLTNVTSLSARCAGLDS